MPTTPTIAVTRSSAKRVGSVAGWRKAGLASGLTYLPRLPSSPLVWVSQAMINEFRRIIEESEIMR